MITLEMIHKAQEDWARGIIEIGKLYLENKNYLDFAKNITPHYPLTKALNKFL